MVFYRGRDFGNEEEPVNEVQATPKWMEEAKRKMKTPEYRRLDITLNRLYVSMQKLEESWERTSRTTTMLELGTLLAGAQEIESALYRNPNRPAEGVTLPDVKDPYVREYLVEQLSGIKDAIVTLYNTVRSEMEVSENEKSREVQPTTALSVKSTPQEQPPELTPAVMEPERPIQVQEIYAGMVTGPEALATLGFDLSGSPTL